MDTTRSKVISFVVSSAMAGVGGGLFGHYLMYLHTNSFTFIKSIEIIIMIVIGGLGSITGSVLGAVLYITLTEGLREFAQYRMVALLVPPDRDHDRAAAGDPRPPRVRFVPDAGSRRLPTDRPAPLED